MAKKRNDKVALSQSETISKVSQSVSENNVKNGEKAVSQNDLDKSGRKNTGKATNEWKFDPRVFIKRRDIAAAFTTLKAAVRGKDMPERQMRAAIALIEQYYGGAPKRPDLSERDIVQKVGLLLPAKKPKTTPKEADDNGEKAEIDTDGE
jgi:hypothetical protein